MKRPILHPYRIAQHDELIQTREGSVQARAGDYVLTGVEGEVWPIPAKKFFATYEVAGTAICRKRPIEVLAMQMDRPFIVKVSWQDSALSGEAGDWLVQYGEQSYGVVGESIFAKTYDVVGVSNEPLDTVSPKISFGARGSDISR
jgi:hypothetical protein